MLIIRLRDIHHRHGYRVSSRWRRLDLITEASPLIRDDGGAALTGQAAD